MYRASMQRANGGTVTVDGETWWLHPIFDDSDVRRAKRTCNDIVRETREARTWPEFPETAVAIASNGSADHLVLMPGERGYLADEVYCWRHDTGDVERVADSFDELVWREG